MFCKHVGFPDIDAPTLLVTREEQRRQVFTMTPFPQTIQRHGIGGFMDTNRLENPIAVIPLFVYINNK